jgi:hypothetical protein
VRSGRERRIRSPVAAGVVWRETGRDGSSFLDPIGAFASAGGDLFEDLGECFRSVRSRMWVNPAWFTPDGARYLEFI